MATQEDFTQGFNVEADPSYLDNGLPPEEEVGAIQSVPWVAIALAVHFVMLVIAWFIIPPAMPTHTRTIVEAYTEQIPEPPPPQQPLEKSEQEFEEVVTHKVVEDQRIPTEDSDHTEDPSDSPMRDLAENPNKEKSKHESPHPNRDSSTSSIGLAGGGGGGGGDGGLGGKFHHRPGLSGGEPEHETNLLAALDWLKDHQNREGYWSATTFGEDSRREGAEKTWNIEFTNVGKERGDTGWEATCDVGLTGLSMLAFTGYGLDHKSPKYGNVLRQALIYLMKIQDNDGCFGGKVDDHFAYNHAIATMAVAELYGISGDAKLKPICDRAVEFILLMQNPGLGWRYGVKPGDNDSSVTGWMVLTLHTCTLAGLHFDDSKCYKHAAKWYEAVTVDVDGYLKTGYNSPGGNNARLRSAMEFDNNPSMDAIYVMSMLFMGEREVNDADIRELAGVCVQKDFLPQWEHNKIDYYYWYYASQALYQVGESKWDTWEKAMVKTLLDHQRGFHKLDVDSGRTAKEVLDEHGSWDPVGAWGDCGGRVYATAINALTLETYYRHQRLSGDEDE